MKQKKVLLLLADGFEIYEASVFIDVMGWNLIDGDGSTTVVTCGLRKSLTSTFGFKVIADITVDELVVDEYDALAIPGGFNEYNFYEDGYSETFMNVIREFHAKEKIIASICTGALPVGKSGVLNGKCGTTYNRREGIRQKALKGYGVNVVNNPIVIDDKIITSWNPSTALDVAFKLLEMLTSKEQTDFIKGMMGFLDERVSPVNQV
jgi:4-methyl-5(b-hydroxyethyl)-thiazole monophosphate biosynthesis